MNAATGLRTGLRDYAFRSVQSLVVWAMLVGVLYIAWRPALWLPHLWMLFGVTFLANVLQPSYKPFEGSRTADDNGTAAQILWTVALAQCAALLELLYFKPAITLDAVSWAAFALMVGGLALRTWAVYTLGRYFTWNVEVQSDQPVIESGPYRFVRHPSYTGALITYVFVPVFLHSWIAAIAGLIALPAAFARRIRHEERLLRDTLPGYSSYIDRTGALFPKLP
ncbi:MAG: isoprenylcysteine carboxylmethyltransferase family protein [Candidatus Sericytochromatia bacterium]|uniref:Isoprenylcysteine carboxylmethyltransferase family protein n=1 Tax=Candidatus Tanganyikabacteria bacterium TaxID=2961651 RepID=A0A937X5X5_9BACT|nr:isoprenylcysteine carboxylmethyltransferase family protein [Candidatus Tanganyikabacteria bacterium]